MAYRRKRLKAEAGLELSHRRAAYPFLEPSKVIPASAHLPLLQFHLCSSLCAAMFARYWSILQCVRDEEAPTLPPGHWSENFRDFLSKCLVKDPAKRADCNLLLTHPFLEKVRTVTRLDIIHSKQR
jgi:serine/threonine protein kinase